MDGPVDLERQMAAAVRNPELLSAGRALLDNDVPAAEHILRPYLKRRPTDVAAIRMLAEVAARVGRPADSETLLRRALELAPEFDEARANLASLLYKENRFADSVAEIERLRPDSAAAAALTSLKAAALGRVGRYEEARDLYARLLGQRPGEAKLWMSYGHVLKTLGEQSECIAAYRRAIDLAPGLGEAWWSLANLKTVRFSDDDVAAMQAALGRGDLEPEDRFHLDFALGKAFEDRRDPSASFAHYEAGNRARRGMIQWKAGELTRNVERAEALFTPAFFAGRECSGSPARDPIFVVGLPRAGSTLIEQILASHPMIEGTSELPDLTDLVLRLDGRGEAGDRSLYPECLAGLSAEELRALGEDYLERTRIQRFTDAPLFIDKLPNNWLHTGFIRLILPNARVIDARRHPLACGFSNFKQHFARGQRFTYDLGEIGAYYRDYVRLMRHFDAVLPGFVHRVIHEDLVDDPEREVRALLDFIGVPFDPACLAFHHNPRAVRTASSEQVRRPISREGLDSWKAFEPWLGPLPEALGPLLHDWRN